MSQEQNQTDESPNNQEETVQNPTDAETVHADGNEEAPQPVPKIDVKATRLGREFKILDLKQTHEQRNHLRYEHFPVQKCIIIGKIVKIIYGDEYPFSEPKVDIMLHKDERYKGHISLFDLQKLQFRDIMKEDYHPSLNFAEIAERSFQFIQKNVVITQDRDVKRGKVFEMLTTVLANLNVNVVVTAFYLVLILGQAFFVQVLGGTDSTTKNTVKNLGTFISKQKDHDYQHTDPFQDNLLVFTIYKILALSFAFIYDSGDQLPDFDQNKLVYILVLKGLALLLQCLAINIPMQIIVQTVYKKNSALFKSLLAAACLTNCVLFTLSGVTIDYQAILFLGTTLWSQSFLLHDNVVGCLVCYGLSLNCSLDALLFAPFLLYRIICKVVKDIYKEEGAYSRLGNQANNMYSDNALDIGLLQTMLYKLQSCVVSFLFGFFVPWAPYFLNAFKQQAPLRSPAHHEFSLFYDHITHSLYNPNLINPHNLWYMILYFTKPDKLPQQNIAFLEQIQVPLFMNLIWNFFVNMTIIILTRGNRKISSHKKHLLQLLLIVNFNYSLGNPKLQSAQGMLAVICALLLILYVEFTAYAIIISTSVLFTYLTNECYLSSPAYMATFFMVYLSHQLFFAVALRQFLYLCMDKQVRSGTGVVDEESAKAGDSTNPETIKKHQKTINEAFRANYSLVRQMTVRGRYGLSKFLQTYQNEVFMFSVVEIMVLSLVLCAAKLGWVESPTSVWAVKGIQQCQLFFKGVCVIIMTCESLMAHAVGPKRSTECAGGSTHHNHSGKKINDGSGPFVNKYNRMEQEAKERDGDVMGLQDADKQKRS